MPNDIRWCFAWYPYKPGAVWSAQPEVLQRTALWPSGDTISVTFLGGDEVVKQRVRDVSREWVSPGSSPNRDRLRGHGRSTVSSTSQ
jgi:hypothetical protein